MRSMLAELGWSQAQFAERIDVSPRTVSLWATDRTDVPKVVMLYLELLLKTRQLSQ